MAGEPAEPARGAHFFTSTAYQLGALLPHRGALAATRLLVTEIAQRTRLVVVHQVDEHFRHPVELDGDARGVEEVRRFVAVVQVSRRVDELGEVTPRHLRDVAPDRMGYGDIGQGGVLGGVATGGFVWRGWGGTIFLAICCSSFEGWGCGARPSAWCEPRRGRLASTSHLARASPRRRPTLLTRQHWPVA